MEQAEVKYAPGMRIIVRGEEWMVKKVETNSLGNQTLYVIGLSQLVKDYESMFLVDVENDIEIVDPAKVTLVPDDSAFFRKSKVYIESQWRSKIPTDNKIHIGNKAAMDLMSYQLEPAQMALNKTRQRILIADTVGLGNVDNTSDLDKPISTAVQEALTTLGNTLDTGLTTASGELRTHIRNK